MKAMIFPMIGALLAATAAQGADAPASLAVQLKNAAGADVGKAQLTEAPNGVLLRIEAKGLLPGWHGLHFHEKGDCSKADFTSAGHWSPVPGHPTLNLASGMVSLLQSL